MGERALSDGLEFRGDFYDRPLLHVVRDVGGLSTQATYSKVSELRSRGPEGLTDALISDSFWLRAVKPEGGDLAEDPNFGNVQINSD